MNSGLILVTGYLTRVDTKQVQNGSVSVGGLTIPGGIQTLLSESEVWDYGRVLEEYVEKYGSIEAVSEYLDRLYTEDSIAEQV